jgi:hypothetical protein
MIAVFGAWWLSSGIQFSVTLARVVGSSMAKQSRKTSVCGYESVALFADGGVEGDGVLFFVDTLSERKLLSQ